MSEWENSRLENAEQPRRSAGHWECGSVSHVFICTLINVEYHFKNKTKNLITIKTSLPLFRSHSVQKFGNLLLLPKPCPVSPSLKIHMCFNDEIIKEFNQSIVICVVVER